MNFAIDYMYRLAPRGGAGLACDETGVALGATDLARVHLEADGRRRCEVRPPGEIGRVLKAAYGSQPNAVVQRLHRGLNRTARWLEAGDLGHAGVEAVMLGFPDLTPTAMAKLAELADLEKRGDAWKDEPRLPAGQAGGGQWTTGGGGGAAKPVPMIPPAAPPPGPDLRAQMLDDGGYRPAFASPPTRPYSQQPTDDGVFHFVGGQAAGAQTAMLDDGVYRPASDRPRVVLISGPPKEDNFYPAAEGAEAEAAQAQMAAEEEPFRTFLLPIEVKAVEQLFPDPKNYRDGMAPLGFSGPFGLTAAAGPEDGGPDGSWRIYKELLDETKVINPNYKNFPAYPKSVFTRLPLAQRQDMIDEALLDRAAADYKIRGNVKPLQVETLNFLRKAVDRYYAEGDKLYKAGALNVRLSREEAIGNYLDDKTRRDIKQCFDRLGIRYGPGQRVLINNHDRNTSGPKITYKVPDARVGDLSFDWTMSLKKPTSRQVKGFINADSKPRAVLIIRPSQVDPNSAYYIPSFQNPLRR